MKAFNNIFDLFVHMGLPDPRIDENFRNKLMDELKAIDTQEQEGSEIRDEIIFDKLSVYEKIAYIHNAHYNLENNPSRKDKIEAANNLIDLHLQKIDIRKILSITEQDAKLIKELPTIKD